MMKSIFLLGGCLLACLPSHINLHAPSISLPDVGEKKVAATPTLIERLKQAWDARETRVDVSSYRVTWDEITAVVKQFHKENPEYYFMFHGKGYEDPDRDGIVDTYVQEYAPDRSAELEEEWLVLNEKLSLCNTPIQKALIVYDHLCEEITYTDALGVHSHDLEGAILEKRAVCEGYALAYKYYMNRIGIPCEVVSGVCKQPHAWNQIQIDGKWYHVDSTWGDSRDPKVTLHRYFMISDDKLATFDHTWDRTEYHPCTDKTYDNAFWADLNKEIVASGDKFYASDFRLTPSSTAFGIFEYDAKKPLTKENGTVFFSNQETWYPKNDGMEGSLTYTQMAIYNNEMYFSQPKAIYKMPLTGGEKSLVYQISAGSQDQIWDIRILNGILYFDANPIKDKVREYDKMVIAPFAKRTQKIALSAKEFNVALGSQEQFLQAYASGKITYESLDPSILSVQAVFEDQSCALTVLAPGTARVKVTAAETDRFLEASEIVTVNITKTGVDAYMAFDKHETINGEEVFTGELYVSRSGQGTFQPTGNVTFEVKGDRKTLVAKNATYVLDGTGSIKYRVVSEAGHSQYELIAKYAGDERFEAKTVTKIYGAMPHSHQFGDPIWNWDAQNRNNVTATFVCTEPGCGHKEVVKAVVQADIHSEPSCGHKGKTIYSATAYFQQSTYNDVKVIEDIPALKHAYGAPFWSKEGLLTATAEFTCTRPGCQHKESLTVPFVEEIAKEATCLEGGLVIYVATVTMEGKTYTLTHGVITPAKGHQFENGFCNHCGENDPTFVPPVLPDEPMNCVPDLSGLWIGLGVGGGFLLALGIGLGFYFWKKRK